VANDLTIAFDPGASGTYDLQGGTLSVGGIINNDTFNWTGGTLNYNSPLTIGTAGPLGAALVLDSDMALNTPAETIAAAGTLTQTGGNHTVTGELRVDGTYHLTGGDVTVSDWTIGLAGKVSGGAGDVFKVDHSFSNHSVQKTSWDTELAELLLSGSFMTMELAGADYGADYAGYTDNFAWGIFHIGSAITELIIRDGVTGNRGAALYVGLFEIDGGLTDLSKIFSDYNIYYDAALTGNGWLGGKSYALNGSGSLMPVSSVPEPTSMLLIGTGLIGLIGRGRTKRKAA